MQPKKKAGALGTRLLADIRNAVSRPRNAQKSKSRQVQQRPRLRAAAPSSGTETSLTKYAAALLHPFAPAAEGARYPEPYAAHTITRKMRMEFVLAPTAAGDVDICIQPHLVCSAFSMNGTITGAPATLAVTNQPAGFHYYGAITPGNLGGLFKSYRIVGWGVRLKSNTDFTRSGGRVIVAVTPASQQVPTGFSAGTTVAQAIDCFEVPYEALGASQTVSTSVLSLPRGHQLAVSELMSESGAEITFPIVSAAATNFLESFSQSREQGLATYTAGGTVLGTSSLGYGSCSGHSQMMLRGVGLNAAATLVCEVIYHVEGIPNPISGSQLVESPVRLPPASPAAIASVVHAAASAPAVQYVSTKMKAAAGGWATRARSALGTEAAHQAERVLGLGFKALML